MSKHKRGKRNHKSQDIGVNLIPGKGKITTITEVKPDEKPIVKAIDDKGQPVLTKEDKGKIAKAKALNVKAREARRQALEIQRQAKDAMEDLNNGGSGAIKAMKQELEAKIKLQEAKAEAMRDSLKAELDNLNSLYEEYKSLTGLDKKAKTSNSKGKGGAKREANGRFNATVKANGNQVKVLVTHKESKSLFETSLYPANGKIKGDDWLSLRHRFIAHFEAKDTRGKADKALPAKDYNLVLRAYLSNLKGKVEAIKPIV